MGIAGVSLLTQSCYKVSKEYSRLNG
jgi:hypothetical protein